MKPLGKSSSNGSNTENGDNKSNNGLLSKMKSLRKKDRNSVVIDDNNNNTGNNKRSSFINKNRKSYGFADDDGKDYVQKLRDELDKIKLDKEIERQHKVEIEKLNQNLLSRVEKLTNDINDLNKGVDTKNTDDVKSDPQSRDISSNDEKEKELNDALTEKEKELEQLRNDLNQKVSTINQLESDLSNSKQEIINEKSELEKIKIELQDQKSCVENLTKELSINKQEAQESVDKYQSESRVALEVNKHEINELKSQNDQLLSNIQQLNNDLTSSKKETERFMKSNQSIQDELDNVKSNLKSIKEESEKLVQENSENVVLINQLKSDLIKESDLLKKHLEEREKQKSDYEKLLVQLNLTKEESSKLKLDYENKINQLTSDLIKSQEEVEIAKTDNPFDKSIQDRLEKFKQENVLLISQIKKLNDDLSNSDSTLNSIKLELQSVTDQRNEALRELENVKSELGSVCSSVHNIKNDLENQSNALKDLRLQLESKENTIQQQKNLLSNMIPKEQYDSLSENLAQFKTEFQSVENLKNELASTKAQLKAAKDAEDWTKKRVNNLSQKLEQQKQLENNNAMLQKQVAELNPKARTVDKVMSENEKLRAENEKLKIEKAQLNELRKAQELADKKYKEFESSPTSPTSPTSPKSESKSLPKTNGDASNGVTSNVAEPPNTKPKRKSAIEPLQSYSIESNEINNSNNQPVPRPKKDTDEGWITVKRRSMKRNSTATNNINNNNNAVGESSKNHQSLTKQSWVLFVFKVLLITLLFIAIDYIFNISEGTTKFGFLLDYYKTYHIY